MTGRRDPYEQAVRMGRQRAWLDAGLAARAHRALRARDIDDGAVAWVCDMDCGVSPRDLGGCGHRGEFVYGAPARAMLAGWAPATGLRSTVDLVAPATLRSTADLVAQGQCLIAAAQVEIEANAVREQVRDLFAGFEALDVARLLW